MPTTSEILEFKISNFNRVAAITGGFLSILGLFSYLLKERFYVGEACKLTAMVLTLGHEADHFQQSFP